jgi:dissimilatory sulfite reductase (desulfoviridin) alpha/beta subunit
MGVVVPAWDESKCTDCGKCIPVCAVGAIKKTEGKYVRDEDLCVNCSACTTLCPPGAWVPATVGVRVLAGGTMGKRPRLATVVADLLKDPKEALALVRKILAVYRAEGKSKERLGHMMDRIGLDEFQRRLAAQDGE